MTAMLTLLFNRREALRQCPEFSSRDRFSHFSTELYQTVKNIKHWMERKHAHFMKEQVSEVHLAADFIGVDIRTLDIANQDRWIHRPHDFDPHYKYRKLTGVSIGKGDMMLRIYDKVKELKGQEHKQEVFVDLWQVKTYDEHPVTRVEYQLRRPVLKEFQHLEFCNGVHTVKNFLFAIKALWAYCTTDWACFCKTIIDRKNNNQSKAKISEFWEVVRAVVWTGLHEMRREKPTKHKNIDALRKQARGISDELHTLLRSFTQETGIPSATFVTALLECSRIDLINIITATKNAKKNFGLTLQAFQFHYENQHF